jgi:CHAT domain-containing protein
MAKKRVGTALVFLALILQTSALLAKTIKVPQDFLTIKTAVLSSRDGDVVEVGDGHYFEKNIVIDKKIKIRARTPFGAVIYGLNNIGDCIYLVRASAEIEGFVLKNSYWGIIQRDSPDVPWKGQDLAFFNMTGAAIEINDRENNIGSTDLENIIIENCETGVRSNDAGRIRIRNGFIANCKAAFSGGNHISFHADRICVWKCQALRDIDNSRPLLNATNKIEWGTEIYDLDRFFEPNKALDMAKTILDSSGAQNPTRSTNGSAKDGFIDIISAGIFLKTGNIPKAQKFFRSGLKAGRDSGSSEIVIKALFGLARISEKAGETPLSVDLCQEAIQEVDKVIKGLPLKFFQSGFFEDNIEIYEFLLDCLYRLHLANSRGSFAEEAFIYSEKSKAVGIFTALNRSTDEQNAIRNSENRRKLGDISVKISGCQRSLSRKNISSEDKRVFFERLEAAEDEYKSFLMRMDYDRTDSPESSSSLVSSSKNARKVFVSEAEALLEYFIGKTHGYVFLVTEDGIDMAPLPASSSLYSLVVNYLDFLEIDTPEDFLGTRGGQILYDILIGPFEVKLSKIRKIIVVPDGILYYLPFETLIPSKGTLSTLTAENKLGRRRYLIEDYELGYVPSASSLLHLRRDRRIDQPPHEMLAVAYTKQNAGYNSILGREGKFLALKSANDEVKSVARLFRDRETVLLTGINASEKNIKRMNLNDFRIIHFATHGFFDDRYWWRSGLLLAWDPFGVDDGLFQALDLFSLKLNADIVVLSACNSGAGRIEQGEGLMGISLSFFLSGARTIVPSLWLANDKSTASLMKKFYSFMVRGYSVGNALRFTKIAMLNSKYAHPRYWAPFIVIGDQNVRISPETMKSYGDGASMVK